MFSFFKKNNKTSIKQVKKVTYRAFDYHPKIILAWKEALEGNDKIASWLNENGYQELIFANAAIYLKNEARIWLMENGFPHLMAFIHAAEGDKKATIWLKNNNFTLLFYMALAIESEDEGWQWLMKNASQDIFMLTKSIKRVKDKIEENHNDIHSFGKD